MKDNEVKGNGNQYDYGFRIYDPRGGRFFSIDPLQTKYPWFTPYQFSGNSPIANVDVDGREDFNYNLVNAKNSNGEPVLSIVFDGKKDISFLTTAFRLSINGGNSELHSLYYKGKPIASFMSFQQLKERAHGSTIEQLKAIQEDNNAETFNRIQIFESAGGVAHGEPSNPARYGTGRSPVENQRLLSEAESDGATFGTVGQGKSSPIGKMNNQSVAANNGNSGAAKQNTANKSLSSEKSRRALQLKINNQNSEISEEIVFKRLQSQKSVDEEILKKPRIYIGDGSSNEYAVPDFAIYNTKTGQIRRIVDAKDGEGGLRDPQRKLNEQGGTFKGSSRARNAKPQSISKGAVEIERTNISVEN